MGKKYIQCVFVMLLLECVSLPEQRRKQTSIRSLLSKRPNDGRSFHVKSANEVFFIVMYQRSEVTHEYVFLHVVVVHNMENQLQELWWNFWGARLAQRWGFYRSLVAWHAHFFFFSSIHSQTTIDNKFRLYWLWTTLKTSLKSIWDLTLEQLSQRQTHAPLSRLSCIFMLSTPFFGP